MEKKVPRSEEDILTRDPILVILGGKKFEIAPLVIRDSRVWRKRLISLIASLPALVNTTMDTENPKGFEDSLTQMMVTMPDQVLDLFFDYAKELDREEIEGTATDAEIAKAFEEVVQVVFPLAQSLPKVLGHLSQ